MSRARGMFARPDLLYRAMDRAESERDQIARADRGWRQFDGITEKVIAALDGTAVDNWSEEHWKVFQKLLILRTKAPDPSDRSINLNSLTPEELRKITTNSADPTPS